MGPQCQWSQWGRHVLLEAVSKWAERFIEQDGLCSILTIEEVIVIQLYVKSPESSNVAAEFPQNGTVKAVINNIVVEVEVVEGHALIRLLTSYMGSPYKEFL